MFHLTQYPLDEECTCANCTGINEDEHVCENCQLQNDLNEQKCDDCNNPNCTCTAGIFEENPDAMQMEKSKGTELEKEHFDEPSPFKPCPTILLLHIGLILLGIIFLFWVIVYFVKKS